MHAQDETYDKNICDVSLGVSDYLFLQIIVPRMSDCCPLGLFVLFTLLGHVSVANNSTQPKNAKENE